VKLHVLHPVFCGKQRGGEQVVEQCENNNRHLLMKPNLVPPSHSCSAEPRPSIPAFMSKYRNVTFSLIYRNPEPHAGI